MSYTSLPSGTSGMSVTDEAIARTQIVALNHRYASLARENADYDSLTELFESDGVIVFPDGRSVAPTQLREINGGNQPQLIRHHLTTVDVQFISPDEAHCQSFVIVATHMKMPDHAGRWDDVFRRQSDGRWLFKSKRITGEYIDPEGWLAENINHAKSASQGGKE